MECVAIFSVPSRIQEKIVALFYEFAYEQLLLCPFSWSACIICIIIYKHNLAPSIFKIRYVKYNV